MLSRFDSRPMNTTPSHQLDITLAVVLALIVLPETLEAAIQYSGGCALVPNDRNAQTQL